MPLESTQKSRIYLSMILLDRPSLPPPQELLSTLAALGETSADSATVETTEKTLAFRLGSETAALALMPGPAPWSNLEGPCATAWWWPEAKARLAGHRSHLLVALMGDSRDAVARSLSLTRLTAVAAAQVDAAGIFWGGGSLVHDVPAFLEEARGASIENLPLHLWIDFRVERNDDGTHRLFTTGMKALGKLELEIPHSRQEPSELLDFAGAIASYILARGAEVRDGHTVGRSEAEQVRATHAPSMLDGRMTVLRLELP